MKSAWEIFPVRLWTNGAFLPCRKMSCKESKWLASLWPWSAALLHRWSSL